MLGSSVYRKCGYMYRRYGELHGNDESEDTLCWFARSTTMNPRLPRHIVDAALAENPAKARAEFENIWREDIADFIPADVIASCTDFGTYERAPIARVKYFAFADAAGGTGQDAFAFAIGHRETSYVLDVAREFRPRFVPAQIIAELAQLCRMYSITEVVGDKYAIGFHEAEWRTHGIRFTACEHTSSENYLALLPILLAGRARLVDSKTLRSQLAALERRVGAADHETISHPQHASAHDDVACAVCGVLTCTAAKPEPMRFGPHVMSRAREKPSRGTMSRFPSARPRCFFGSSDQR
jgi:hypothetical protein